MMRKCVQVGYCGADLKALCTEAAMRALRRRYPQVLTILLTHQKRLQAGFAPPII